MPVISIIGPKCGIGKTTLSINTTAALTRMLGDSLNHDSVCLFDLGLRLPTISSILESHPRKTLSNSNGEILQFLQKNERGSWASRFARIASSLS